MKIPVRYFFVLLLINGLAHAAFNDIIKNVKQAYGELVYGSLGESASKGDAKSVKRLIELGHNVDEVGNNMRTPLHNAQNVNVTQELIKAGAQVNSKDTYGWTPLGFAAQRGDIESIRELMKAGAEHNQAIALANAKNAQIVEELIKLGVNPNSLDYRYGSALHLAQNPDVVDALIKAGANVNARSNWQQTTLHTVKNAEIARILIKAGADVNAKTPHSDTPLHTASSAETAHIFIAAGADLNATNNEGDTPLYEAIQNRKVDVVEELLNAGANPNIRNRKGWTPRVLLNSSEEFGPTEQKLNTLLIEAEEKSRNK